MGEIGGRIYAFVGLERNGGIIVYDVTDPSDPTFATYELDRNYEGGLDPEEDPSALQSMGNLGPEGLVFITAEESPTGAPLLVVAYEVSGTLAVFSIEQES